MSGRRWAMGLWVPEGVSLYTQMAREVREGRRRRLPAAALERRNQWVLRARPRQRLYWEREWAVRGIRGGRGAGKTWANANWLLDAIEHHGVTSAAMVAPTHRDAERTCWRNNLRPLAELRYGASQVEKVGTEVRIWGGRERGGATIDLMSAEKGDRMRGPEWQVAGCDELGFWPRVGEGDDNDPWENLNDAVRLSPGRIFYTTTPLPSELMRELDVSEQSLVTVMTSWENIARLAPSARRRMLHRKLHDPRRYRQENLAELLEGIVGALFDRTAVNFDEDEYAGADWDDLVLAVDPAGKGADRAGWAVVGRSGDAVRIIESGGEETDGSTWGRKLLRKASEHGCHRIVAEVNGVGQLLEPLLTEICRVHQMPLPQIEAVTAARAKWDRAEAVKPHFDVGRVKLMGGMVDHDDLIDEMLAFTRRSTRDDVLDAAVIGVGSVLSDVSAAVLDEVEEELRRRGLW